MAPMIMAGRNGSVLIRVSSVGRTSDSESEGPWFEPTTLIKTLLLGDGVIGNIPDFESGDEKFM
jgi:hypothetical protein